MSDVSDVCVSGVLLEDPWKEREASHGEAPRRKRSDGSLVSLLVRMMEGGTAAAHVALMNETSRGLHLRGRWTCSSKNM